MKKSISLKVNGAERHADVEPRMTLLDLVREQFNLTGAKLGCDIQVCGACTILLDGKPVSACSVLAVDTDGCEVLTIEGLSNKNALHPLQEAFMEFGALQCGYCTSGFILTAKALLDGEEHPLEAGCPTRPNDIRQPLLWFSGQVVFHGAYLNDQ